MKTETEIIKTTLRLPKQLWRQAQHRAIDEERDCQALVADALSRYLKTPPAKKDGAR
jgi:hypothetical protein